MDPVKGKQKLKERLEKTGRAFGGFLSAARNLCVFLFGKISEFAGKLFSRMPEEKRRPLLACFAGLVFLLFILIVGVLIFNSRKSDGAALETAISPSIPVEDLFIPGEPDFVPEFIPEREPRLFWSVEDIRPYWKDPSDPALWRNEIKAAVDALMEGVP